MKNLFTLTLVFTTLTVFSQVQSKYQKDLDSLIARANKKGWGIKQSPQIKHTTPKKHRAKIAHYMYYTCTFNSSDGCKHDQFGKFTTNDNNTPGYFWLLSNMENYIRPYKIDKKTFTITGYKEIDKKEWLSHKGNKFHACEPKDTIQYNMGGAQVWGVTKYIPHHWPTDSLTDAQIIPVVTGKFLEDTTEYKPDTIPVFFKELVVINRGMLCRPGLPDSIISYGEPQEWWSPGFVIWQTQHRKNWNDGFIFNDPKPYYDTPYPFIKLMPGRFLYLDKTPVPGEVKIIAVFKRSLNNVY